MTLQQFFHMGGYALYVWLAYAMAFVVLIINLILPLKHRRQLLKQLKNNLGDNCVRSRNGPRT